MKYLLLFIAMVSTLFLSVATVGAAESVSSESVLFTASFPNLTDQSTTTTITPTQSAENSLKAITGLAVKQAIWPLDDKNDGTAKSKQKSTRKAFFLSMIMPGLGEAYVGSKTGFIYFGLETVAWWLYMSNTGKGNDLESEFQDYANKYWHYAYDADSAGNPVDVDGDGNPLDYNSDGNILDFNYFKWLQWHFREVSLPDDVNPYDFARVDSLLSATIDKTKSSISDHSKHDLPPTKTQQYYEMIGKYPQFVYGWEDIDDLDTDGNRINPTIRKEDGTIKFDENISNVQSDYRMTYEDMRDNSNKKLKAGQRGIHLMLINRVLSAVNAGRLAYKHNKKLDSELSNIDIQVTQKYILDNKVTMLTLTKTF